MHVTSSAHVIEIRACVSCRETRQEKACKRLRRKRVRRKTYLLHSLLARFGNSLSRTRHLCRRQSARVLAFTAAFVAAIGLRLVLCEDFVAVGLGLGGSLLGSVLAELFVTVQSLLCPS